MGNRSAGQSTIYQSKIGLYTERLSIGFSAIQREKRGPREGLVSPLCSEVSG